MFGKNKPLATIEHTVKVELPDIQAAAEPVLDRLSEMMKTLGYTLAIGIPCVIVFGFAMQFATEVAINNLTAPPE